MAKNEKNVDESISFEKILTPRKNNEFKDKGMETREV